MPTFPKYRGELPQCLNPRNIRHYFLLAYWVYFRPTALNCYLYEASPECYQLRGLEKIRRTWNISAYRSLYLMSIPAVFLFVLLLGLMVFFWLWTWQSYKAEILHVNITSDDRQVISTLFDGTVKVWDLESGKLLHTLSNHIDDLTALAVTLDGQKVVTASSFVDVKIKIWDLKSGQLLHTMAGHTESVKAVGIFPDRQRAFSISWDGSLKVWDLESGKLLKILSGSDEIQGIILIPNSPEPFDKDSVATAVTPDGKSVVSVSSESFTQRSQNGIPSVNGKSSLRVWDIENGKPPQILSLPSDSNINAVALTPDGQKAISSSYYGNLNIWDIKSGKLLNTLPTMNGYNNTLAMTPDGQKVIFATYNKTLEVWDLKKGKLLHTLSGHTGYVTRIITPDGKKVVSASGDGNVFWPDHTLKVWDLESGKLLHTLSGHTDTINSVLLTSDGKKIVSASKDHTLKIWDLETGKALPLWWSNGLKLVVLGLVSSILCILTVIFFPVIVSLNLITFNVAVSLIVGVASSLLFSTIFTLASTQFVRLTITGAKFNTLGFPAIDATIFSILFIGSCVLIGTTSSFTLYSLNRKAFSAVGSVIPIMALVGVIIAMGSSRNIFFFETFNSPARITLRLSGVAFLFSLLSGFFLELGSLRLLFYPVQLFQALYSQLRSRKHPIEWDELLVLPLPGTRRLISQRLQQNEVAGMDFISELARNPFQRSAVQKALKIHLHNQAAPLHLLYKLLTQPDLNTYIVTPVSKKDWEKLPTTGNLLLGELSGQWVDCSSDWANRWSERLVYWLTKFRRDRRKTPLTHFAEMLYQLLDRKTVKAKNFDLSSYHDTYSCLTSYPGGEEIANSFSAMVTFLHYDKLSSLPEAVDIVKQHGYATLLTFENAAIRPTVLTTLVRLGEVGAEIAAYRDSTTQINKQAAILRATGTLEELEQYVTDEVFPPEQAILQEIIVKWRKLVTGESGIIGRATITKPVTNPYIAGNPVTGTLFVGREDIMRRLEEIWSKEKCESVVLFGHRRMGKTSILKNLGARFGTKTITVDFNMQGEIYTTSTADLLYHLAIALYDSLPSTQQQDLVELQKDQFTSDATTTLKRFLNQLDIIRDGLRFIVTIDEFEIIEQKINKNQLEPGLLDFFRYLIQKYDWFIVAFAGLHNLQEMTHDYWNPLFGSITTIQVTFLSHGAAYRLITQPSPDFELDYDQDAITHIIELTNGQPFLVQLICRELVTRFNTQSFEEEIEREKRLTLEDAKAVVNTPDFYQGDGNAYFKGVWAQAATSKPTGQLDILKVLCDSPHSSQELAQATSLSLEQVNAALETLQRHDVIQQRGEQYIYTVELMRRWAMNK